MNELWRDVRHSLRSLRKSPGFLVIVILTLGLGIGANTAIFSLMDQVLLRPLPVHDPGALVLLDGPGAFMGRTMNAMTFSYPMYKDFRDRNDVFSGTLARFPLPVTAVWQGASERADGELVSGNYFDVLGVRPAAGRLFNQSDDRTPRGHPIAVLSYGYWQRRFGGDPRILNQTITVNGHPFSIAGVSERRFTGVQIGRSVDIMVPIMMKAEMTPTWDDLDNRRSRWLTVMARLKPGVSRTQSEAAMNVIYRQINEQEIKDIPNASESFRKRFTSKHLDVLSGQRGLSDLRQEFSTPLIVLMSMVGVVLLISCANVANLLLARTMARHKEISLRLALGASRARIVRQQFVESGLLSLGGTAVGLLLAWWTGGLLLAALPGDPAARSLSADPDLRVALFALAIGVLTALVFGIVPAVQATRTAVTSALKEESGSVAGGGRQARVRRVLVVAQVALSMLLLAGAGLFARSLYNLKMLDPGFRVDDLFAFSVDPSLSGYDGDRLTALYRRMQEELTALPGVRSVSMSETGALTGNDWSMTVRVDGYQAKEGEDMNPSVDGVGPRYFETMGIPLVSGRDFTERDVKGAPTRGGHQRNDGEVLLRGHQPDWQALRIRTRHPNQHRDRRRCPRRPLTRAARSGAALHLHPLRAGRKRHATDLLRARSTEGRLDPRGDQAGRAADRREPSDLRHEDDGCPGGRVAVCRADGCGPVGRLWCAGDAARRDWPLRCDVVLRHPPDA